MKKVSSPNNARQDLLDYMRGRVGTLTKENYGDQNSAFCHFALQILYGLDDDDAGAACGFGGVERGGVDAFWQDDEEDRVVLIEAKYRSKARLSPSAVDQLASTWLRLNKPTKTSGGAPRSQLAEAAAALAQAREGNPRLRIELLCVTAGGFTASAAARAAAFNAKHSSHCVLMRLIGIEELIDADVERRSLEADPISSAIDLDLRQYFLEPQQDGGVPTLVASIDGRQLADIEREYRLQLFQRNVRYQLPGKINENIDKTLKRPEGRRNFWYYNNGISIVCDRFELDEKTGTVAVHNMQIVNGCQTTTTLSANAEHLTDPSSMAVVLVRIIASDDQDLQRDITLYNNKQNAVKDRDLLSNDYQQERLKKAFDRVRPPWFYERKRGSLKAELSSAKLRKRYGSRIIHNEKAAQAAYAFHFDPGEARARKRLLFVTRKDDPNGFYDLLFNRSTTPEWLLVPFLVNRYVAARKRDYTRQVRELEERPVNERSVSDKRLLERSWIKFADQALVGTIAFYWRRGAGVTQAQLRALSQPGVLEEILPQSYALAIRDLSSFFNSRVREYRENEDTFVAANYLKGHWQDIREFLSNEEDYRRSVDEYPLADLPVVGRA
jgi:ADP-ribosylglycohydrolase